MQQFLCHGIVSVLTCPSLAESAYKCSTFCNQTRKSSLRCRVNIWVLGIAFQESWVDPLIAAGADLNSKNKEGVSVLYFIMKHCPNCLIKCLDNCVNQGNNRRMTRHDKSISNQSVGFEVRLDFNSLDLRKHYRKENDFKKRKLGDIENTTDPTIFFSQVLSIKQDNDPSLNRIIEDIFLHPVSQTYFYLKWSEIKFLYYIVILFTHFVYSVFYSTYAVLVYRTVCNPSNITAVVPGEAFKFNCR